MIDELNYDPRVKRPSSFQRRPLELMLQDAQADVEWLAGKAACSDLADAISYATRRSYSQAYEQVSEARFRLRRLADTLRWIEQEAGL